MKLITISSTLLSAALGLSLSACTGDDGVGVTATAGATDTTTDATDTTGDPTGDPTTDSNACDACSADATCNADGSCTCKDGYDGDGQNCTDLDECESGKNTCDPDATCTNEPGDYKCECNEGYKGNGMTCKDIDECTEDTSECDANASCTNNDGGYDCECNEGYDGDGFTCQGSKEFGEVCDDPSACISGLCITDTQCTVECSIEDFANDCGKQGYYGLCIFSGDENIPFVCAGEIDAGNDSNDDKIVYAGETVNPSFQSVDDLDIHLVKIGPGNYDIFATPNPDDDIAVIFYNIDGSLLAEQNMGGAGEIEGANVDAVGDPLYVIVANIGDNIGSYTFEVIQN